MSTQTAGISVLVEDRSQVAVARRAANDVAERIGLPAAIRGRVELVATELATNLVAHTAGGTLIIQPEAVGNGAAAGLLMLSLDRGPGIPNVPAAMRDGWSTAGTAGNGLGAIRRTADRLDVYSLPQRGTVVLARFGEGLSQPGPTQRSLRWASVSIPRAGEIECGDLVAVTSARDPFRLVVVDGVGHGPDAAAAAGIAARTMIDRPDAAPADLVDMLATPLRATRGAVVAVAQVHLAHRLLTYAGIGNISGRIVHDGRSTGLVSHHGTVGLTARKARPHAEPWPEGAVLVMHSDGLHSRWSLDEYPGLASRDPAIICGVLLRDAGTRMDDATVLVAREEVRLPL